MIQPLLFMVDRRFKKGIELFNEEEFFECHEEIEDLQAPNAPALIVSDLMSDYDDVWLETQDEYKNLYKGVIQAAVCLHHLRNGNVNGAKKLHKTSTRYLNGYRPEALGLNVEQLIHDLDRCVKEIAEKESVEDIEAPKLQFKD